MGIGSQSSLFLLLTPLLPLCYVMPVVATLLCTLTLVCGWAAKRLFSKPSIPGFVCTRDGIQPSEWPGVRLGPLTRPPPFPREQGFLCRVWDVGGGKGLSRASVASRLRFFCCVFFHRDGRFSHWSGRDRSFRGGPYNYSFVSGPMGAAHSRPLCAFQTASLSLQHSRGTEYDLLELRLDRLAAGATAN